MALARRTSITRAVGAADACTRCAAQDESDEDADADEEKEALRLQREAAAGLRADDFDLVRCRATGGAAPQRQRRACRMRKT